MNSINEIQMAVCNELHVGFNELTKKSKQEFLTIVARAISIVLCYEKGFKKAEIMSSHGCTLQNFKYALTIYHRVKDEKLYKQVIFKIRNHE